MKALYKIKGNSIIEVPTKQVIKTYKNRNEAVKLLSKLITGTGFEGQTPPFFCRQVKVN